MKIEIDEMAQEHIRAIKKESSVVAAYLLAYLQTLRKSEDLHDVLLIDNSLCNLPDGVKADIKKWYKLQKLKENFWRLRFRNCPLKPLEKYRIIYVFYPVNSFRRQPLIRILAILQRQEIDYDDLTSENVTKLRDVYKDD